MIERILFGVWFLLLAIHPINAQENTFQVKQELSFNQYLQLVSQHNLEYAAERFNVPISEAALELAGIFPNPSFSFGWTDNSEGSLRSGYAYNAELGTTLELGGKRKARIDLAKSEKERTQALLEDYFRSLRSEAAIVYLEAIKRNQLLQVNQNSYETMKKLSEADSIRLFLGSIMETDAIQSKLEAGILFNELLEAEAEQKNALWQLKLFAGSEEKDTIYFPNSTMKSVSMNFELNDLIEMALNNRADLKAAYYNTDASYKASILARKERRTDLDLSIGLENEYFIPGAPGLQSISAGIAIPLKFSNFNTGDLKMAQLQEQQAEKRLSSLQLLIRSEISEAYHNYVSTNTQLENFKNNLLNQSKEVLNGKIYSYQRGETSLLEILNAQRTYNEIQTSYIETLYNNYIALIELEKAVGIWDLSF